MRNVNGLHVLLMSALLCGMVQTAAGQSSATTEVLAALAERDKAYLAGDETKVAQFMSEDYLQTSVSGDVQDKQAWLKEFYGPLAPMLRSGKTRYVTFERSDIVVRDFGDTMVMAGKQTLKHVGVDPWDPKIAIPADSPRPPGTLRFTHVWIKRGGAWKLAVVHNAIPAERK
jgi:ketosteroid isomerase-like protein